MDECVRLLGNGPETPLDLLLATQVKCQIITNQLTCPSSDGPVQGECAGPPSTALASAMLAKLADIRQNLLAQSQSESK